MQLDDKTILDLAGQLGISADKKTTVAKAKSYEQKSDAELVSEIMKIKNQLEAANIPYEKQMAAVQSLMPMMNGQQKARLTRIIELLKK
ncbi:hypothetical protein AALA22_03240 [Anaerovoracaceae bacterium 41-7]|jgi:hypothetical protein|uniref:Uncharacterized protein n=1 Tax=Anaerotruncus colihominis TaxID=169435 RepID=A0A845QL23_9FIRM|nr:MULTISPECIES: hypothetical protein [Clostridia]MCI9477134.1 hypothetical protein [Emergencia sp.]MCI9640176.1 hypothetical protein [Emergencia sp.]NBH61765.1 hypothetical protein [Anaerotruncus colihominis]NCE98795.1 hypothetical protein [Emergencia sp. 1XD21-10]NCF02420.1 hypothetical protein [Anaerotruncus sp. 80]